MNKQLSHFVRATILATGLSAAAFLPAQAANAGEADIEGVPEITRLGPEGQPVHPVVRDGEDMRHIVEAGPEGRPAPVVVRDGEGSPEIDRLGPNLGQSQRGTLAGHAGSQNTL